MVSHSIVITRRVYIAVLNEPTFNIKGINVIQIVLSVIYFPALT